MYHSFGFKYFSSRNHISWCCFNSIPLLIISYTSTAPISRSRSVRTFQFERPHFAILRADLLQIEIYYNKRKVFWSRSFALVRYFSRRSELSLAFTSGKLSRELLSRGGAPIILDPRKGISFLFKERISLSL